LVARDLLELCYRRISLKSLTRLYQSEYLALPASPGELPETLESVSLLSLAQALGSRQLLELSAPITAGSQPLPAWFREFRLLLNNAGWNAGRAGSLQYQAYQQLCRLLDELGHSTAGRPVDSSIALDELLAALSLRLFAPQRDPAPIQILGYLETTGLSFSHLWITGMDEDTWPATGYSNPLLPMSLRRNYGLPRSTPADELAFASNRLKHWQHCSKRLIVSHPGQRGDRPVAPSPLIANLAETSDFTLPVIPHPYFQAQPALEEVADDRGNPIPPGLLRGGTGLFTDQAGCPFRAWAINRLGLAEPRTPHAFPDPLDRGRLFHGVMQALYQAYLGETGPIDFTQIEIDDAVARSLDSYYQRFPQAFIDRERERLLQVVNKWLELESSRASFSVEALETSREVTLGDVRISLRVDRLDRIDQALIIIDYKTGGITLPAADGFLIEPQLPVYAMTDQRIAGVFYAQLDESKPRLSGIASADVEMGQIRVNPAHENSWPEQIERWRRQLLDLAAEISSGYAQVLPRRPGICDRCHLAGLCRINERREML
jgi:probable DNA repair protein